MFTILSTFTAFASMEDGRLSNQWRCKAQDHSLKDLKVEVNSPVDQLQSLTILPTEHTGAREVYALDNKNSTEMNQFFKSEEGKVLKLENTKPNRTLSMNVKGKEMRYLCNAPMMAPKDEQKPLR